MNSAMTTIDVSVNGSMQSAECRAYIEDRLGPMPGKWDGYDEIGDEASRKDVYAKVGYIHGVSSDAGRNVVAIGKTLCELKELLPHGQFMSCVKAEFGWSRQWALQLMQVAERFSNDNSGCHLPSSAKVLALLASTNADDATVQQAADEHWTVAETKQRLRKPGQPRQQRSTEALALSLIRKGEVDQLRAALALAEQSEQIDTAAVMAEVQLRQLPKGSIICGMLADFHKLKDDRWLRMPHAAQVDVAPIPQVEVVPEPQAVVMPIPQAEVVTEPVATAQAPIQSELLVGTDRSTWELVSLAEAAKRLGVRTESITQSLSPCKMKGRSSRKGRGWEWEIAPSDDRGMCRIRRAA